jgi:hypothetical protein
LERLGRGVKVAVPLPLICRTHAIRWQVLDTCRIEYRPSKYLGVRHLEFTQLRKFRNCILEVCTVWYLSARLDLCPSINTVPQKGPAKRRALRKYISSDLANFIPNDRRFSNSTCVRMQKIMFHGLTGTFTFEYRIPYPSIMIPNKNPNVWLT